MIICDKLRHSLSLSLLGSILSTCLRTAFMLLQVQKRKKLLDLTVFFLLLGSARVKLLVKWWWNWALVWQKSSKTIARKYEIRCSSCIQKQNVVQVSLIVCRWKNIAGIELAYNETNDVETLINTSQQKGMFSITFRQNCR